MFARQLASTKHVRSNTSCVSSSINNLNYLTYRFSSMAMWGMSSNLSGSHEEGRSHQMLWNAQSTKGQHAFVRGMHDSVLGQLHDPVPWSPWQFWQLVSCYTCSSRFRNLAVSFQATQLASTYSPCMMFSLLLNIWNNFWCRWKLFCVLWCFEHICTSIAFRASKVPKIFDIVLPVRFHAVMLLTSIIPQLFVLQTFQTTVLFSCC